jgi:hypothetical protein
LTNESENALPLDETFWNHIEHSGFSIGIPVSENKMMNVLEVLRDIYDTIENDPEEGRKLVIMMAAILVASKDGHADKVWEELSVQESMKDLDLTLKEILDEKQ